MYITRYSNVVNIPRVVDGVILGDLEMSDIWLPVEFVPYTLDYDEKYIENRQGGKLNIAIRFVIAQETTEIKRKLRLLRRERLAVLIKDLSTGQLRLIGGTHEYLEHDRSFTTGPTPSSRNQNEIKLTGSVLDTYIYSGEILLSLVPPSAPSSFAAAVTSSTTMELSWVAPPEAFDSYLLERSTSADFTTDLVEVADIPIEDTTYEVSGLATDTQYYYRLSAFKSIIQGSYGEVNEFSPNPFTFTVLTTNAGSASDTFVLPFKNIGTFDCYVEWGDGDIDNITAYNQAEVTHVYGASGSKTIKIWGTMGGWQFSNSGDVKKITSITRWGDFNSGDSVNCFQGASNLTLNGCVDGLNYQPTNLQSFFQNCTSLTTIGNVDLWDVSLVATMFATFSGCSNFNALIGSWNISNNLTALNSCFSGCNSFNQPLNSWDVTNVTGAVSCFANCSSFNQDLDSWNVAKITSFSGMFSGCSVFNGNITTWVTTAATNMGNMFQNALAFNQNISGFDMLGVTNAAIMFDNAQAFNQDISSWNMSTVTTTTAMFRSAKAFNQNISGWNVASVTSMNVMFAGATTFNQNISSWNVSLVTTFNGMFTNAIAFDQDLGAWNIASLTGTGGANMFSGVTLSIANYDSLLAGWNANTHNTGVTFSGGNSVCTGGTGNLDRVALIGDSWTITDGN